MIKVSVIVPVYNVEDYLSECIESIIKQTYQEYEVILIDDGSSDGSRIICERYRDRYPDKIKTIYLKNGGPLRARLIGVRESTGDILIFLDSDDCVRVDALSEIVKSFETYHCDMVLFDAGISNEFSSCQIVHSLKSGQIFAEDKYELYEKIIQGDIPNSVCLKAVRKGCACFPEHFLNLTVRHGEDLLLSTNFITNCKKIVYLNEGLYFYRDRPGSAVHLFNFDRKGSIKIVHKELEKYIEQWKMPELKPLHNARKVRGWMNQLKLLLKNKKKLTRETFKDELISMSEDSYFRNAYRDMDQSLLSHYDRELARCLYKKQYLLISGLYIVKMTVSKLRRNYDK